MTRDVLTVAILTLACTFCGHATFDFPGAGAGLADAGSADAAPSCSVTETACGDRCVDITSDLANCGGCSTACNATEVCLAGRCGCSAGRERCGSACARLESDPLHCGVCDVRCDGNTPVCNDGTCRPACTNGRSACSGACFDLRSDPENCGACAAVCENGACTRGECVCATGQVLCGKRCVDTANDARNCGVCGRGCAQGSVCSQGNCN